ncbi:MAG: sigma-54 dependent transcriptional regulator [Desulfobulbus sp.]|jgi:two-component system NtrC family response regulator|uniref:sigma-54-dependent transcriptional regulator n=1 Tax=Desulfobulbus sp. TaxID=895 RepID=UPI002840A953|nr:sigma-54 dependent transcriptional regulator [Desulfobulbus sp.]MDR2549693.1 sigma-54 dependent transcriptional regulator [Desulfobulbus sp.]
MSKILIIDTQESFVAVLAKEIVHAGHQVVTARTLLQGLELATASPFDVIFLNAEMPDGNSMGVLPELIDTPSLPEVIILADAGDADQAENAIKMGAWDYVERPGTARAMTLPLVRAMQYRAKKILKQPHTTLNEETLKDIVGNSLQMKRCLDRLALSAGSDANVLITGETGTGKELFAWAIHNNSRRAGQRFVVVDCAALPETLVESILFGYERGAFTGADKSQSGLIKRADGGTLFLDEVGELPLSVQKSFLRVLQEHKFRQVGGGTVLRSDFRLIAATNRNLDTMVQRHRFRKDLLFRLRSFTMELPSLRHRIEDVPLIAAHHVDKLCQSYGLSGKSFSPDFFEVLGRYEWPGNVRELVNALERAVSAARHEPVLFPKHLPIYIRVHLARASVEQGQAVAELPLVRGDGVNALALPRLVEAREVTIAQFEQRYLRELLNLADNMEAACSISGLSRSRLYALLKKHNLSPSFRLSA